MGKKSIKATYLEHSGFLVELEEASLVFDYYKGDLPALREDKPLIVLVSHAHPDHFQKVIFTWRKQYPDTTYVLSSHVMKRFGEGNVIRMKPLQEAKVGPCAIETLRSTDEGVAFLVNCGGIVLYHAGDLNWWHWEEEGEAYNRKMKEDYQREIARIAGQKIHVAFVPVDPRLEQAYFWGLDWYMKNTDTEKVFPMHFWKQYEIYQRLMGQEETASYRSRIVQIQRAGEVFAWESESEGERQ